MKNLRVISVGTSMGKILAAGNLLLLVAPAVYQIIMLYFNIKRSCEYRFDPIMRRKLWSSLYPSATMATSILLACGLNEQRLQPYTHLNEESGVDSTFLISSILGQRIRIANSGTILICLHQTFSHYSNAGLRLGYNLQMSLGKNLRIIDILDDIANDFLNSKWTNTRTTTKNLLQMLWDEIQVASTELLATKSTITVIIDDLSALLNLGASPAEIIRFCNSLRQWSEEQQPNVAIVTKLNTCDQLATMMNQIGELGDVNIEIERLKSGNFKEVDGKIVVKRVMCMDTLDIQQNEKSILYKVLERNIKIFNPGEVGIKV